MEFERFIKYENINSKEEFVNPLKPLSNIFSGLGTNFTKLFGKKAASELGDAAAKKALKDALEKQTKELVGSTIQKQTKSTLLRRMADGTSKNFVKYRKPLSKLATAGAAAGLIAGASGLLGKNVQKSLENTASDIFGGVTNLLGDLIPEEAKQIFSYICIIFIGVFAIWLINLLGPIIPRLLRLILILGIITTICVFISIDINNDNEDLESTNKTD